MQQFLSDWLAVAAPLTAFAVSMATSMVGVSGAFLLLPLQMSLLGTPAATVSATNLVFNVVATPGGILAYWRERRVDWRLGLSLAGAAIPGLFGGWWIRAHWLADPRHFRAFVGLVMLGLAWRLLAFGAASRRARSAPAPAPKPRALYALAFVVGTVGGAYGIGGGAIMAPVLVTVFRMPVHAVAGATLLATLITSIAGVLMYSLLPAVNGIDMSPDWRLGLLLGVGGLAGSNVGARLQKRVEARALEMGLGILVAAMAASYLIGR